MGLHIYLCFQENGYPNVLVCGYMTISECPLSQTSVGITNFIKLDIQSKHVEVNFLTMSEFIILRDPGGLNANE